MQHVPTQQFWHAMQFLPTQQFWPTLWFYMFDGWCFRFNNARTTAFFLTTNATGMYVQVPLGCRRCDLYKTVRGMCFPLIARINSVRFLNHIICFIFIVVTLDRKKGIATLQLTQPLTLHGLVYCWDKPLINIDIDRMGSLNLDCQEALTMYPFINGQDIWWRLCIDQHRIQTPDPISRQLALKDASRHEHARRTRKRARKITLDAETPTEFNWSFYGMTAVGVDTFRLRLRPLNEYDQHGTVL